MLTAATSRRSLYVGATRGRHDNRLLVVTDEPGKARDVLEQALANDRADTPAVAQRRHLAAQLPGTRSASDLRAAEAALATARRFLDEANQRAEPFLQPLRQGEADLRAAYADHAVAEARVRRDHAEREAAPFLSEIDAAEIDVRQAKREVSAARIRERLGAQNGGPRSLVGRVSPSRRAATSRWR